MSGSSDSSNTVDHLAYIMPLYLIITDVLKDFDISDITPDDISKFLTKQEEEYILEKTNRHCQIFRLLDILDKKPQNVVNEFLAIVRKINYWFNITKEHQLKESNKAVSSFATLFHELRTNVSPKYPDLYVRRVKPFLELRQSLLQLHRHGKVALFSDFGFGKKWLAVDVCSDYEVMEAMGFKIYWIKLGQCKSHEEDLRMLKYLYQMLRDPELSQSPIDFDSMENATDSTSFVDKEKLMLLLKKELDRKENKNCLVVLEDIQITKQFYMFNLPCKLLVITRNKKIVEILPEKSSFKININRGLERSEFFFFMEKYVGVERENFPKNGQKEIASDIYNSSKGHLYLLSIIAHSLHENPRSVGLWNSWVQNLRDSIINDNIEKYFAPIRKSLDILEPALRNSYNQLVIFSHGEYVPIKLLKIFWKGRNVNEEIKKLYEHSFLEKSTNNKPHNTYEPSYKLPFIFIAYLRSKQSDEAAIVAYHKKVLDYYSVAEGVENRSGIGMFNESKHDFYFFLCLGHHLRGAKTLDLFPKIYLDFGFLQQKIRTVGLLRTIADLNHYEKEITRSDHRRRKFLEAVRDFLIMHERTLIESKDSCLLQCALMYTGNLVHNEALRQVQKFPDRLWLQENGYFHQHRQVIQLTSEVKHVIFLDAKFCLVFYDKGDAALIDTSMDAMDAETVRAIKLRYAPAQVFLLNYNSMHLLMLDNNGELMLWSDPHSQVYERANIKPAIDTNIPETVVAVYVCNKSVLVAKNSGKLEELEWNENSGVFKQKQQPSLQTHITNICSICIVFEYYSLVIDKKGGVSVWYVVDSSRVHLTITSPLSLENFVYLKVLQSGPKQKVLVVCEGKISILLLEKIGTHNMIVKEEYYLPPQTSTSATLTTDENYLVLGTKCGLYIFDMRNRKTILPSNFHEEITCVDVHPLVDEIHKNIIACGSDRKVLNLFSLRQVGHGNKSRIQWAHFDDSKERSEQGVWLKHFDVTYNDDRTILIVVQTGTKNRICRIKNHEFIPIHDSPSTITGVTICGERAYAGNANGDLIDVSEINSNITINLGKNPIKYLQLLDEDTLIASTKYQYAIIVSHRDWNIPSHKGLGHVKYSYKIVNGVLAILKKGELWYITAFRIKPEEEKTIEIEEISCCDFKDGQLFTASKTNEIFLYTICGIDIYSKKRLKAEASSSDISCLAISNSNNEFRLVAVGNKSGVIKVYTYSAANLNELKLLHILKSHECQIFDMKFSPSGAVLVSCSETLCFWSVIYMLNNPFKEENSPDKEKQTNSRYNSSSDIQEVDATVYHTASTSTVSSSCDKEPSWRDMKVLSSNRPILACIKFDGNQATKFRANNSFTRFHTIDSEGVCYALSVNNFRHQQAAEYQESLPESFVTERSYEQSESPGGIDV